MAAPQQSGGQSDNSAGILWGVAAIFATLGFIWYAFKDFILSFYFTIKLYELNFLSLFNEDHFVPLKAAMLKAIDHPDQVTFSQIMMLGSGVGDWLRFPFIIILILLAVVVYSSSNVRSFRRAYNMKELANLEKANWPQITPTANLNLIKT